MKTVLNSHHPVRHIKSFRHAFRGLFHAMIHEPNFRVQLMLTGVTIYLGFNFAISNIEWSLLVLAAGFLLFAEMVNTVVEEFIDNLIPHYHEGVRIIKDLAAGFVLTAFFTYLVVFTLIFGQRLADFIV